MDEFDTKINRMKRDIEMIKNEINGIQNKNKKNKGYLKKSINSLSIHNTIDNTDGNNNNHKSSNPYSTHNKRDSSQQNQWIPPQMRKKLKEPAMALTVNEYNEEKRRLRSKINKSSVMQTNSNEEIIEEIRSLFNSNLSNEDIVEEIRQNKQKEDFATSISQQFNLGKCDIKKTFAYVTRFMNQTEQTEQMYQEEISLYQSMCEELLRRCKDKVNEEHLNSFYNKILSVENELEKYHQC